MSVGVTCDESKNALLAALVASGPWTDAYMMLSEADITPDRETVLADLDVDEVTVSGYARQPITGLGTPAIVTPGVSRVIADPCTFINTSGGDSGTIYTWGIVDDTTGHLIEAGRWDTPFVLEATIGEFVTTPTVRLSGE